MGDNLEIPTFLLRGHPDCVAGEMPRTPKPWRRPRKRLVVSEQTEKRKRKKRRGDNDALRELGYRSKDITAMSRRQAEEIVAFRVKKDNTK